MYGATVDLDDASLRALGVHRLEVPVPFVEAGGPANVYAIEEPDGRWALFDTGIGTDEGIAALKAGFSDVGIALERLSRIFVSHGHIDHFGNAQWLAEASGARVFIHDADRDKVVGDARFSALLRRHRTYFLRDLGVPELAVDELQAFLDRSRSTTRYVEPSRLDPLNEGDVLRFKHFDAVVRHLPGHTPGLVCLHAAEQRLLFADDHVLARVSPNPLLDLSQGEGATKFKALVSYLHGARVVRDLELDIVAPGHGPAFRGHRELLDGLFDFYERRQDKLLTKLRERPASAFELLPVLFPRREPQRLVLMLSEVLANLEVLEERGAIGRGGTDVVRYEFRAHEKA